MLTVEVLISAMYLDDIEIVNRTNIQTDAVVINQCNIDEYKEFSHKTSTVKLFSSTDRGLSKSRNKAIELATGDICLFCDDDEYLYNGYKDIILKAYSELPNADIIVFKFLYPGKKYGISIKKIGFLNSSSISSVELSFKRKSIVDSQIKFNHNFGSGSIYSAGEENMFIYDCLNKGLQIYYYPLEIGKLLDGEGSKWFRGFNEKYFFDKGAWLAACFPKLKYIIVFYALYRFRKLSEMNYILTFKYLWKGLNLYKRKLSYIDYKESI